MKQGDGERFRAGIDKLPDGGTGLRFVQGLDDLPTSSDPFRDATGQFEIGQWVRLDHNDPARQRARCLRSSQVQHLFKVLGHEQADLCAFLLKDDVGRDCGAV